MEGKSKFSDCHFIIGIQLVPVRTNGVRKINGKNTTGTTQRNGLDQIRLLLFNDRHDGMDGDVRMGIGNG